MRWYRRASREVTARVAWGVPVGRILDSLQTAKDLAGLRRAYVDAGSVCSTGGAASGTGAGAAERRVEDAAFGLRWLQMVHARRFGLTKSLAREVPLEWLRDPSTGVRHAR